jgi:hypothetical protein
MEVAKLDDLYAFLASEEYQTAGIADEEKFLARSLSTAFVGGVFPMWDAEART